MLMNILVSLLIFGELFVCTEGFLLSLQMWLISRLLYCHFLVAAICSSPKYHCFCCSLDDYLQNTAVN